MSKFGAFADLPFNGLLGLIGLLYLAYITAIILDISSYYCYNNRADASANLSAL